MATKTTRRRGARTTDRRSTPERDSHGRFKPEHHVRYAAVGAATAVGVVAAGIAAAFRFGWLDRLLPTGEGHSAADLEGDEHPGPDHRAPVDFRPDMDAPMTKAEREALRPAGHKPSLAAAEGDLASS